MISYFYNGHFQELTVPGHTGNCTQVMAEAENSLTGAFSGLWAVLLLWVFIAEATHSGDCGGTFKYIYIYNRYYVS